MSVLGEKKQLIGIKYFITLTDIVFEIHTYSYSVITMFMISVLPMLRTEN